MTERLADITARIGSVRQLGAVVNAMRGIAVSRAQQAHNQLTAVDRYAATIGSAIAQIDGLLPPPSRSPASGVKGLGLVLFCAEQGFAGAFSERVLDEAGQDLVGCGKLMVAGTRGAAAAAARQVVVSWQRTIPSHSTSIPKLATDMVDALLPSLAAGEVDRLEVLFCRWQPGEAVRVVRQSMLPLDRDAFPVSTDAPEPLLNLPPTSLLAALTMDHLHAQLCQAALHSFAAENQARMEAMAAAHTQTERALMELQSMQRRVRQEGITAEIIELAAGETASRERAT